MNACDCLPLCAVVNNSVFAIHAGLSSRLHYIHEIDSIDRFQEIPMISCYLMHDSLFEVQSYHPNPQQIL